MVQMEKEGPQSQAFSRWGDPVPIRRKGEQMVMVSGGGARCFGQRWYSVHGTGVGL